MVSNPPLVDQIHSSINAAKEAVHTQHAQSDFHLSIMLSHIRAIPDEWNSDTKRTLTKSANPSLENILQSISVDIESSGSMPSRIATYQALLRFAIVIYGIRSGQRSTGP